MKVLISFKKSTRIIRWLCLPNRGYIYRYTWKWKFIFMWLGQSELRSSTGWNEFQSMKIPNSWNINLDQSLAIRIFIWSILYIPSLEMVKKPSEHCGPNFRNQLSCSTGDYHDVQARAPSHCPSHNHYTRCMLQRTSGVMVSLLYKHIH